MEGKRTELIPIHPAVPLHALLGNPLHTLGASAGVVLATLADAGGEAHCRLGQAAAALGEIDFQNTDPAEWQDMTMERDRALQDIVHLLALQITGLEVSAVRCASLVP